jgi:DNA-binding MarR family transcriptional regulator
MVARAQPANHTWVVSGDEQPIGVETAVRAVRLFAGVTAESIAQLDDVVTLPQLRVLVLASSTPGLSNSAVAEELDVHLSNATRICDRLVQAGLISRREAPTDRRRVELRLTSAGEAVVETVIAHRRATVSRILRRMTSEEQQDLSAALERLLEAAGETRGL